MNFDNSVSRLNLFILIWNLSCIHSIDRVLYSYKSTANFSTLNHWRILVTATVRVCPWYCFFLSNSKFSMQLYCSSEHCLEPCTAKYSYECCTHGVFWALASIPPPPNNVLWALPSNAVLRAEHCCYAECWALLWWVSSTAVLSVEHCCAECRALLWWVSSTAVLSVEHCCAECRALLCWVPSTAVLSVKHCCAECRALLCRVLSTAAVLSAKNCCAECWALLLCWVLNNVDVLSVEHCCRAECWALLLCWVLSNAAVLSAEHCWCAEC